MDARAIEQLSLLLDSISDYAIFLLDAEGHVATWTSSAQKLFDYSADEVQGRHFSCLYPEVEIQSDEPQQELRMAAAHGRFEDISWRVQKDGTQFWADSIICPLRN